MNFYIFFIAAVIPLAVGAVWYNPKVLGNAWMKSTGLTEEQLRDANMLKIFGLTYVLSLLIALSLFSVVVHQSAIDSIFLNEPGFGEAGSTLDVYYQDFMAKYGRNFRTFKHGAFHGALIALMFAMPVIGINALFERKSFKYVAIHAGYWVISLALMGGLVCQFA